MMAGKKAFITGVNMTGRQGSLQVIPYPHGQKTSETFLHSQGVTRICVNFDQTLLFSCSSDGSFAMMTISDRDPRRKDPIPAIATVTEHIIPKVQRDTVQSQIQKLKAEISVKRKAENIKHEQARVQKLAELS
jgi:hypothetical protein